MTAEAWWESGAGEAGGEEAPGPAFSQSHCWKRRRRRRRSASRACDVCATSYELSSFSSESSCLSRFRGPPCQEPEDSRGTCQEQVVGMGEGRDLRVGILDTLVVVQDKGDDTEGKLGFPGEFREDRGQGERQD